MKKVIIPVFGVIGASVIVISGSSQFIKADYAASLLESSLPFSAEIKESNQATSSSSPVVQEMNSKPGNPVPASAEIKESNQATPSPSPAVQENTAGVVSINYRLHHLSRLASNQLAIWIEDERGSFVKTLFATSFTANGGYVNRPESLPEWRKAADWNNASQDVIKRVSRPEQGDGNHSVYWDGTNEAGKRVQPGTYIYKIEGNIEWNNRVIYTGKIAIGGKENTTNASAAYFPKGAEEKGTLVEQVTASFLPGETIDPAKTEVITQTRGS